MDIRERIGIDLGTRARIEDGLEAAAKSQVRYVDVKVDVAPNAIESLTPERVAGIRSICEKNKIHLGVHTLSAVNVAEVAPHVRDGVERYLIGNMDACRLLGGEWIVVHAGFHFTSDRKMRMQAGLERLKRIADYADKLDLNVLLENLNREPDDAEVHYLACNLEETQYYFDQLKGTRVRWSFTANHAHLVPEGVEGFLNAMDFSVCDEVRLADCFRNGHEVHLKPGEGDLDFAALFQGLESRNFKGHYMNAFGTLQDMLDGREYLAKIAAGLKPAAK